MVCNLPWLLPLQVVMTVMGQEAKDIYTNQQSLKQQVADAAGVKSSQVYFYNQTANMDPRTGVTAMSVSTHQTPACWVWGVYVCVYACMRASVCARCTLLGRNYRQPN